MTAEGRQMGAYRLHARIGAGGMGDVYRAHDTKLGRDVAIKILPERLVNVPGYRERFDQEARVLAALNHPNIAAIYGVEETTDAGPPFRGIVLELIEGEPLADRLRRGALPVRDALDIAIRIADALEAAHDSGVVHRDLKPANIQITPSGVVKVLDFGLAKVVATALPAATVSQVTIATPSSEGLILGTAPYMSPEQARGGDVNEQTDVWAFGCVLYEMLTGQPAFARLSAADTIAAILECEPDWGALPPDAPSLATRVLRRCLEKDPRRRTRHIADVRLDLEEAVSSWLVLPSPDTRRRTATRGVLITAMVASLTIAAVWLYQRPAPSSGEATSLSLPVDGTLTPQTSVAVSPDGRRVGYVSTDASGRSMLWVRELRSQQPRALIGTEDAAHPFWSPDGASLGFLAGGKVKRVGLAGGSVLTLADTSARFGASWSRSGVILFAPRPDEFATVPAGGGPVTPLAITPAGSWPSFLPDGRHFLYVVRDSAARRGIYVGSLDSPTATLVIDADFKGAYAAGYLLFVRGETLLAQPFDADRHEISGQPIPIAEGVWGAPAASQASFSASETGVLAYVNSALSNRELSWFDRSGRSLGSLGPADRYHPIAELSPDDRRVAIGRGPTGDDLWIIETGDQSSSRVTFEPTVESVPKWGADGRRILYQSWTETSTELSVIDIDRSERTSVAVLAGNSHLWDWSRDERFVVYSTFGSQRAADLWVLPMTGLRAPYVFAESKFHKTQAQISPNGKWLAYTSYESGRDEVYVQSFPRPGSRRQISVEGGGMQPRWRADGRELFYLRSDQFLMAVPLAADQAPTGVPAPLFRMRLIPQGSQSVWFDTAYEVTSDGQRFLVTGAPRELSPPITVVLNWMASISE